MRLSSDLESLEPRTAEEVVDQALAGAYADSACFTCSFQAEDMVVLHMLRRLARVAPEARLLVLAAYRDRGEEPEPAFSDTLADLSRLDGVTRLALGSLSTQEVGELATALRMLPRPRSEWASVEQTTGTPASTARRTCASRRSMRSGRPLISIAFP